MSAALLVGGFAFDDEDEVVALPLHGGGHITRISRSSPGRRRFGGRAISVVVLWVLVVVRMNF